MLDGSADGVADGADSLGTVLGADADGSAGRWDGTAETGGAAECGNTPARSVLDGDGALVFRRNGP